VRVEQLEYVAVITRLGSFRRAAEELNLSQPALSETVRNLESELGVTLLDRGRHGARVSDEGYELLPHIVSVLDAVDRLREVAGQQQQASRVVRLGTVNAATAPLLAPAVGRFHAGHPATQVEITASQQEQIHAGLRDGSLDLGLVNYLDGDDPPPDLETTELLRGRPVVCIRTDNPWAERTSIRVAEVLERPLVAMRAGYVMHRYLHRIAGGRIPSFPYSTDGADIGKLLVAEGLGAAVLPDFSVIGDPLEQQGVITCRPLADDDTSVTLVIQRRRSRLTPRAATELHQCFLDLAGSYGGTLSTTAV
jgi:DNA-binding transcriptional LysR family regulator